MTGREVVFIIAILGLIGGYYALNGQEKSDVAHESARDESAYSGGRLHLADLYGTLPGFYLEMIPDIQKESGHLLLVTADLEMYRLIKTQIKYTREYIGIVDAESLKIAQDGSFGFYDYAGRPFRGGEWLEHPQLDSIKEMNLLCARLLKLLNKSGIELSLRLDRDKPVFTEKQFQLLRLMIAEPEKLAGYMRDRGFETLWINDLLNERLYNLHGYLVLPAALKDEPAAIFESLGAGTYVPDSMDE